MTISFPSEIKLSNGRIFELTDQTETEYGKTFLVKTKDGKSTNPQECMEQIRIIATHATLSGFRVDSHVAITYHLRPMSKLEFATHRKNLNKVLRDTVILGRWVMAFVVMTLLCGAAMLAEAFRGNLHWATSLFFLLNLFFVAPMCVKMMEQYLKNKGVRKD